MTTWGWLIFALWLTLVAYWCLAAYTGRAGIGRWIWWREIAVRLGFFALAVAASQVAVTGHASSDVPRYALSASPQVGATGVVLCVIGIGLVILARASLRRHWTVPAAPASPELVTTGPYAWVRHPIYGGMLLAMLGSAIGQSVLWLLPLAIYGPSFIRSARHEERLLLAQFPERYGAYMQRTKMLLPLVL
jgi:protein-S-isoprenylcysteine O-methyltransferase Ste14